MLKSLKRNDTLRIGESFYIQDWQRPLGMPRFPVMVRREPWEVLAFLPRVDAYTGQHLRHGSHLVQVRSLRDGRVKTVSDWILKQCEELGLQRDFV